MLVSFDSLNRFETPTFALCNPGSYISDGKLTNVVGMLANTSDEELVLNFGSLSELNFRITSVGDGSDEWEYLNDMYLGIQNRRLIFVENIGYFAISSVHETNDGAVKYKDVDAKSIEVELEQKMIPYIQDGTYRFVKQSGSQTDGIMDMIMRNLPMWSVDHIDSAVAERYRTFEAVDVSLNCYGFLMNNVQDAYECIFIYDIVNRKISVYDKANYIDRTDIVLTRDDLEMSVAIEENADDLYTALTVRGSDDVTVSSLNPIGSSTIYDFSYYIPWMSPPLRVKVTTWMNAVRNAESAYATLNLQYYTTLTSAFGLTADVGKINTQLSLYKRCRDNIVAQSDTNLVGDYNREIESAGGTQITIESDIAETLAGIDALITECETQLAQKQAALDSAQESLTELRSSIQAISSQLSFETYFTQEQLAELNNYIFEGSYTDEYVVLTDIMTYSEKFNQMRILYDRAKGQIEKISRPSQEFSVDVENFIFSKDFAHLTSQLQTGCLITAELDDGELADLFLSNITVNYEDNSLSMTFGNRYNKFDPKSLFENVLGSVSKSANSISYLKDVVAPIKDGELDKFQQALQASRDLTMAGALASTNEDVIIDGSGYTGRRRDSDGNIEPEQVKITGKSIVFTDDAWESSKVAIGKILLGDGDSVYGVNAEALIGDMIIGGGIRIIDENGEDLFSIVDGKIQTKVDSTRDDIEGAYQEYVGTQIEQTQTEILAQIVDTMTSSDEWSTLQDSITSISATAQGIVTTIGGSVTDLEGFVTQFNTFFRMAVDGLTIGKEGSDFETKIDETKLSFVQSGTEVAYIQYNRLYISEAWITDGLFIDSASHVFHMWEHIDQNGVWCLQILGG